MQLVPEFFCDPSFGRQFQKGYSNSLDLSHFPLNTFTVITIFFLVTALSFSLQSHSSIFTPTVCFFFRQQSYVLADFSCFAQFNCSDSTILQSRLPSPLIILEALLCTFSRLRWLFLDLSTAAEPSVQIVSPQVLMQWLLWKFWAPQIRVSWSLLIFSPRLHQRRYYRSRERKQNIYLFIALKRCFITRFTYSVSRDNST